MDIFITLFTNLLPLYGLIALGFIAGKYLKVDREPLANIVIYMCLPVVVFGFVSNLEFKAAYALLPIIILGVSTVVGLSVYLFGQKTFGDNRANLLSMAASMPNAGYFGLPLVLVLFEPEWVAVYMFMMLGITVYEATIGYYIAARGAFTMRDSLIKLAKFPALYAIVLALAFNASGLKTPELFNTYWGYFKGVYVVLGMMIIGAALAQLDKLVFGPRFISFAFAGKFLLWPALIMFVISIDKMALHIFDPEIHRLMTVLSIVPPAANIAAFAAQLNVQPEKAATTVLAGTIFALFYIPFFLLISVH